uniref:Uncharacterized protein n=1 Tax=Rhabditophanes sp. KR3021 TaxID=114890 RepID=A0AC35TN09_9BILA
MSIPPAIEPKEKENVGSTNCASLNSPTALLQPPKTLFKQSEEVSAIVKKNVASANLKSGNFPTFIPQPLKEAFVEQSMTNFKTAGREANEVSQNKTVQSTQLPGDSRTHKFVMSSDKLAEIGNGLTKLDYYHDLIPRSEAEKY